jgi:hypothetical protein
MDIFHKIDNKLYKECNVIMLESNIPTEIYIGHSSKLLGYTKDYIPNKDINNKSQNLYIISNDNLKLNDYYIITYKTEEGYYDSYVDLCNSFDVKYKKLIESGICKKIIAATDKSLNKCSCNLNKDHKMGCENKDFIQTPNIPESFINYYVNEYNKDNKINKVLVEVYYKEGGRIEAPPYYKKGYGIQLKLNNSNFINIKK